MLPMWLVKMVLQVLCCTCTCNSRFDGNTDLQIVSAGLRYSLKLESPELSRLKQSASGLESPARLARI